mgnify:CR=1 FL=1
MMDKHDVNISIPPSNQSSDIVKVSGVENKVVQAIAALEDKVKELEEEKKDKVSITGALLFLLGAIVEL